MKINWEYNFNRLREFIEKNGRLPGVGECEPSLFSWTKRTYDRYDKLSEFQKKLLSELKFTALRMPRPKILVPQWRETYNAVKKFVDDNNRLPDTRNDPSNLRSWVLRQISLNKTGDLSNIKKELLDQIKGWVWKLEHIKRGRRYMQDQWNEKYNRLLKFIERHGRIPSSNEDKTIVLWMRNQQFKYNQGKLPAERLAKIQEMNEILVDMHDYIWDEKYPELKNFVDKYNRLPNSQDDQEELLDWFENIKRENLTDEQITELESLPCWKWNNKKRKRTFDGPEYIPV